jgi:hypothetical protein
MRCMDEGDLLRVDGRLAVEAQAQHAPGLDREAVEILEVDVGDVPGLQAPGACRVDESSARMQQPVPAEFSTEFGGQVGTAQHQRAQLSARPCDGRQVFNAQRGFHQRTQRREVVTGPGLDAGQVSGLLELGTEQPVDTNLGRDQRGDVEHSVHASQCVDAQRDRAAIRGTRLQPAQHLAARLRLPIGVDGILEVDADEVGTGGHRLREAFDALARDEEHGAGRAAWGGRHVNHQS